MRSPRRLALTATAAAMLAALIVFGLASHHSASFGRPAPAFPRERLAGQPVTLADLLAGAGGRPVLVTFWASWCGPCAREAPALERFSRSSFGHGRLVGINWSDARSAARSFIRRYRWTFSNLRDAEGTVGNEYGVTGLPTTFVIDRSGRIRNTLRGPQAERSLTQALSPPPV